MSAKSPPAAEPYLTVPEAAAYLKLSRLAVYKRVEAGEIPHFRLGKRSIRLRRSDLDTWALQQATDVLEERMGRVS